MVNPDLLLVEVQESMVSALAQKLKPEVVQTVGIQEPYSVLDLMTQLQPKDLQPHLLAVGSSHDGG